MTARRSIDVEASPETLFDLSQDYGHRLSWDPFLKEARLLDGAEAAGLGVRAWCVARSGLGMETRYVSFNPPGACAVEMTRGPSILRSFAGSWRFSAIAPGRTRATFAYRIVARPAFLSRIVSALFNRSMRPRLDALKREAEAIERRSGAEPMPRPS